MSITNQDTARLIVKALEGDALETIAARAREIRLSILQIFADAEHWNRFNVPWKGPAIDPDPNGQLKRMVDVIDRMLAAEQVEFDRKLLAAHMD